jgi:hypothetical protein
MSLGDSISAFAEKICNHRSGQVHSRVHRMNDGCSRDGRRRVSNPMIVAAWQPPESLSAGPSGQGPITAGANIDESWLDLEHDDAEGTTGDSQLHRIAHNCPREPPPQAAMTQSGVIPDIAATAGRANHLPLSTLKASRMVSRVERTEDRARGRGATPARVRASGRVGRAFPA